jgi:hypothetical protein
MGSAASRCCANDVANDVANGVSNDVANDVASEPWLPFATTFDALEAAGKGLARRVVPLKLLNPNDHGAVFVVLLLPPTDEDAPRLAVAKLVKTGSTGPRKRLADEARRLVHFQGKNPVAAQHIARALAWINQGADCVILLTEYVEEGDLTHFSERLSSGGHSLPAATVDRLMKEVSLAVSEFGPHGDLHAGNVLIGISADGNSFVAKVCDWSPVVSRSTSGATSAQAVALAARGESVASSDVHVPSGASATRESASTDAPAPTARDDSAATASAACEADDGRVSADAPAPDSLAKVAKALVGLVRAEELQNVSKAIRDTAAACSERSSPAGGSGEREADRSRSSGQVVTPERTAAATEETRPGPPEEAAAGAVNSSEADTDSARDSRSNAAQCEASSEAAGGAGTPDDPSKSISADFDGADFGGADFEPVAPTKSYSARAMYDAIGESAPITASERIRAARQSVDWYSHLRGFMQDVAAAAIVRWMALSNEYALPCLRGGRFASDAGAAPLTLRRAVMSIGASDPLALTYPDSQNVTELPSAEADVPAVIVPPNDSERRLDVVPVRPAAAGHQRSRNSRKSRTGTRHRLVALCIQWCRECPHAMDPASGVLDAAGLLRILKRETSPDFTDLCAWLEPSGCGGGSATFVHQQLMLSLLRDSQVHDVAALLQAQREQDGAAPPLRSIELPCLKQWLNSEAAFKAVRRLVQASAAAADSSSLPELSWTRTVHETLVSEFSAQLVYLDLEALSFEGLTLGCRAVVLNAAAHAAAAPSEGQGDADLGVMHRCRLALTAAHEFGHYARIVALGADVPTPPVPAAPTWRKGGRDVTEAGELIERALASGARLQWPPTMEAAEVMLSWDGIGTLVIATTPAAPGNAASQRRVVVEPPAETPRPSPGESDTSDDHCLGFT